MSSNKRYRVDIDENEFAFIQSCQEGSNLDLIKISTLTDGHVFFDVITIDRENQLLVQ